MLGRLSGLFLLLALSVLACGGRSAPVPELPLVPGSVLLHFHIEGDFPEYLLASLPEHPPLRWSTLLDVTGAEVFGVSLLGVDISDLTPQLLCLVPRVDAGVTATALATDTDSDVREAGGRFDLLVSGRPWGSVASRDAWTAVYLGRAPEVVLRDWLELEPAASLAADTALVDLLSSGAPGGSSPPVFCRILVPGSLLDFLAVAPVGRWFPFWDRVEVVLDYLRPEALLLELGLEPLLSLELYAARAGGDITRLRLELEDEALQASVPALLQLLSSGRFR